MTLRWQIALALAVVAAFVGSATATAAYVTTANRLKSNVDQSLTGRADALGDHGTIDGHGSPRGGDHGGPDGRGTLCPDAGNLEPATAAQVVTSSGGVTACITGAPKLPISSGDLAVGTTAQLRTVTAGGHSYRVVSIRYGQDQVIQIGRDLSETEKVLSSLRLKLGIVGLAGVILASVLGWLLAGRITRPIVRLRDTAEAIAETQNLHTPIPLGGSGEVGSLAASLALMVGVLQRSRDQQQRLVDDASHEMRTPLTSLTTNLEHLHHYDEIPAGDRREVLEAVQGDVGELTNLLTELVELATDRSVDDEPVERLDLAAVAREVAARTGRRSDRTITVEVGPVSSEVPARPSMVERAISNLLDNAVKYSPDGSPIEVVIDGGRLEVRDHGRGISPTDLPHVFDRFYRAVEARTEPGSGLGLAIVRQIVDRHGGTVWARPAADGPGAWIGFELPTGSSDPAPTS